MGGNFVAVQYFIPLFSISQAVQRQVVGWFVSGELEKFRNEVAIAYSVERSHHFSAKSEKKYDKSESRATDVGFQSRYFQNTGQIC
jgi:hypothetical protein